MDSTSVINMFDTFKHQIWEELGPLDPCWFDALTAKVTEVGDATVTEQDALINMNANQTSRELAEQFKTPFKKRAPQSQLFSTPKIFRHSGVQSPETEDELLCPRQANTEKETTLPWADSSSCLFETSKDSTSNQDLHLQDSFDLIGTPKKTVVSSFKSISKSLGTHFNPDISWTSSLNTPPAMSPTVILSKTKDQVGLLSPSAEKEIIFVRKLFPSLSNTSGVAVLSPEKNDAALCQNNSCCGPETDKVSLCSSEDSLLNGCNSWRQTLPDAIEDRDIRCTVASVLDGAEDVLSIFFSNSASALRRVKTKDRIKRKLSGLTKDPESTPPVSTTGNHESSKSTNEEESSCLNPVSICTKSPIKMGDGSSTQWTQISLSGISDCDMTDLSHFKSSTGYKNSNLQAAEHHRTGSESCHLGGSGITGSAGKSLQEEHTKKTRKFIYSAQNAFTEVPEIHPHKSESSPRNDMSGQDPTDKTSGDAVLETRHNCVDKNTTGGNNRLIEREMNTPETVALLKPTNNQDSDSSQLSKAVAEDFCQTTDSSKPGSKKEETAKDGLFASSCLLALRQRKKKLLDEKVSSPLENAPHPNSKGLCAENTVSDSGYSSTLADVTLKTELSFHHSISSCCSFNTGNNVTMSLPPEGIQKEKALLDNIMDAESTANIYSVSQQLSPVPENIYTEDSFKIPLNSAKMLENNKTNDVLFNSPLRVDIALPFNYASGFKTASEKNILVSTASLEKATDLFKEVEEIHFDKEPTTKPVCTAEVEKLESLRGDPANSRHVPSLDSHLTASQRADVSELCTFLEEAESQFEFTQHKSAKLNIHRGGENPSHKECDPEFLAGIDFDDSFSTDADKKLSKIATPEIISIPHMKADEAVTKSKALCTFKKTKEYAVNVEEAQPLLVCGSKIKVGGLSPSTDRNTSEMDKPAGTTAFTMSVGFQTARGNNLVVSKKCLSKARVLFEDLEDIPVMTDTPDRLKCIMTDVKQVERVFDKQGRGNYLNVEKKRFVDGNIFDNRNLMYKEDRDSSCLSNCGEKICILNVNELHGSLDKPVKDVLHPKCTQHIDKSSACKDMMHLDPFDRQNYGFKMANGEELTVAAKDLEEASTFFKDCDLLDNIACASSQPDKQTSFSNIRLGNLQGKPCSPDTAQVMIVNSSENVVSHCDKYKKTTLNIANEDIQQENSSFKRPISRAISIAAKKTLKPRQLSYMTNSASKKGEQFPSSVTWKKDIGFSTTSGKNVSVSNEALIKAKTLLNECDKEDILETTETSSNFQSLNHKCPIQTLPHKIGSTAVKGEAGFSTASGKKVSVSNEALIKAKTLLKECDKEDALEMTETSSNIESLYANSSVHALPQKKGCTAVKSGAGFSTASGKKVLVSNKALMKAKTLLKECDKEDALEMTETSSNIESLNHNSSIHTLPQRKGCTVSGTGFSTASGKKVSVTDQALVRAKALFNESEAVVMESTDSKCSISEQLPSRSIPAPQCLNGSSALKYGTFSTASGEKVSVTDGALMKAKAFLNECEEDEQNKLIETKNSFKKSHQPSPVQAQPPRGGGFQTASGKGVAISNAALLKAKTLFNECDDQTESLTFSKAKNPGEDDCTAMKPKKSKLAFMTAGGKKVLLDDRVNADSEITSRPSSDDVSKSTCAFDINSLIAKTDTNTKQNPSIGSDSFSTASGKTVFVSNESIQKAKSLLNDCYLIENEGLANKSVLGAYSSSSASVSRMTITEIVLEDKSVTITQNENDLTAKICRKQEMSRYAFNTASGKDVSVSEKALKETFNKFRECEETLIREEVSCKLTGKKQTVNVPAPLIHNKIVPVKNGGPKDCGITSQSPSTEESSSLGFESLGLSGCTVTQQKYFAQEAMDCTKALLEDDDLGDLNPTATSVGPLQQPHLTSIEESGDIRRGLGKRSADNDDVTNQPLLKRRLLDDFDRFVKNPRQSTLNPSKSSSDGVLKDRRVFKYNVSLHPNVTRPFRNKRSGADPRSDTTQPQQTTPCTVSGDSKPLGSRTAVFVPPCRKKATPERTKTNGPQETATTPGVFLPLIRKKCSPAQEHSNVTTKTTTHVPPFERQSLATEIDANGKSGIIQNTGKVDSRDRCGENLTVDPGKDVASALVVTPGDSLVSTQDATQNIQSLQLARDMQHMRIRKMKRQTIRPLPGSLFLAKTSGLDRVSLREAVNGGCPVQHTQKQLYGYGVHQHVSEITSENAESFRFKCQQFFKQEAFIDGGGIQLADGGWLIPSNDGTAGKEEFYRAFCDSPGVDPKLISEDWLYNHYRWIVWKQASLERSFPARMGSLCLTPEQVLLQLKHRYDVEVDHSRRPALRKIMERDDTAAKTMVLCVCGVVSVGHNPTRPSRSDPVTPQPNDLRPEPPVGIIRLTDGWYAIKAQIDAPLTAMLRKGRLAVGGKVIVHGAELIGSQDACSPLEAPESLMLKIGANSTRPARWDAKLGFYPDPRPFLLPISSLYSNGGPAGCVDIIILRSYPTQWMEKKLDGGYVFRGCRAEEKEDRRYNDSKQKAMEILYSKVQAQFEEEELGNRKRGRRQTLCRQDIETLQDGEELHEAVENDPVYLENQLSDQQLQVLNNYRRSLGEKKQADMQERYRRALEKAQEGEGGFPKRDVTPVWKLSIADTRDQLGSNVYSLNLWRPSMDMQSFLKEGCRYKAYHLTTSDGKKRGGNATVQLTVTKKTQFQPIRESPEWLSNQFQPRISAHFVDLQNPAFRPLCGEVDLVGYVGSITDRQGPSPVLYLVDGKLNFVKVRCSNNLTLLGLDDLVKPRSLLALSNLQLQPQPSTPIPSLYAGDLALFSSNPKETHLQEAFTQLRNFVLGEEHFFPSAEERLSNLTEFPSRSSILSPAIPPRTPVSKTHNVELGRHIVTPQQPLRNIGYFTPLSRNLPPLANSSADKDPKSVKRKRGLDYLSRVPSPPPLCPLATLVSPSLKKTFNPPRKALTPSTLKTDQTPAPRTIPTPAEGEWVKDEELALIDTQAFYEGL